MNIQHIRHKFSLFLKQFRIDDLKLLMKFLEIIVNEYKNSRASRLFDLLSESSDLIIDDTQFQYEENNSLELYYDNEQMHTKQGLRQNKAYCRQKLVDCCKRPRGSNSSQANKRKTVYEDLNESTEKLSSINTSIREKIPTKTYRKENSILRNEFNESDFNDEESLVSNTVKEMDGISHDQMSYQNQQNEKTISNTFFQNVNKIQLNTGINSENSSYSDQSLSCNEDELDDKIIDTSNLHDEHLNNCVGIMPTTSYAKAKWMKKTNIVEDQKLSDSNLVFPKCAVCSDSASGTRYGVCVCEGCKEFFRRQRENSANRQLHCVNGTNDCEINLNNRTQCRKCRLEKCIRLGMKLAGK